MKFKLASLERIFSILVIALALIWHCLSLTTYPMYFPDDGMMAGRVKTLIEAGHTLGSLEEIAFREIPDVEKVFSKLPYYLSSIASILTKQISLFTVRSINIVFIFSILILSYLIATKLHNPYAGIIVILLLGFCHNFTYSSHIARHDLISTTLGLSSLYIFLINKNKSQILDLVSGLLLVLGLETHPRIIIYIPIIACLYLQRYGKQSVFSKNCWTYASSIIISGAVYYFIFIAPNLAAFSALNKMTIGASRSIPLLGLDFSQFWICTKEIFILLKNESYLFLAIYIELIIGIIFFRKSQTTVMLAACLFFTAGIMRNFYDFNSIIVFPILVIGSAIFFSRLLEKKISAVIITILILNFSYSSVESMSTKIARKCNLELENNASELAKIISKNDTIIGVDSFWFNFQENKFYTWVILNYFRRFHDWDLEQAFKHISPDYLIADGRFFYFTRSKPKDSDWFNNFLINFSELDLLLKKYSTVALRKDYTCNGSLVLYKFNWDKK